MFNDFDTAILFLRFGIAFLYIYAAYVYSKDKESLSLAIESTKPLFWGNKKKSLNLRLVKFFTYIGIAIMYIGGISILIGIEARIGALLLFFFTIGGTIIHFRLKKETEDTILSNPAKSEINALAHSAHSAHFAGMIKDVCLIFILIFIFLNGVGKFQICEVLTFNRLD